eukprot:22622_1
MSSFLKIHAHEFKDEDDEDEDYKICDFAMKRVQIDINAVDSNIALHTRSKVTLPDTGKQKHKINQTDEAWTKFLHTLHDDAAKDESQDEDFEIDETDVTKMDEFDANYKPKIPMQILRDLNECREYSNASLQPKANLKKVTAHIRIRFHEAQRQSIRDQLTKLFQLLVIVRHLSHNTQHNAHSLSTQLLYQYNYSRLGSMQSIRFAIANKCGIFDRFKTKHMSREEAINIARISTQHVYIDSMMDIESVDEYFQFNERLCRSFASVLNRFRGVLLEERYIPSYDATAEVIPTQDRNFTATEEKLLGLGVEEYGQKLPQPMISNHNVGINRNIMINHWTAMRDRFLPHKTVESLQKEIAKIRTLSHELRHDYRLRPPSKEMSDFELGLLAQGTRKYGEHSWAKIVKELLPNWTPKQLRRNYRKKLKPLIETMKYNAKCNANKIKFFNPSMDLINAKDPLDVNGIVDAYHQPHDSNDSNHNNNNDIEIDQLRDLFCVPKPIDV